MTKEVKTWLVSLGQQHNFIGSIAIIEHRQAVRHTYPRQSSNILMLDVPNDVRCQLSTGIADSEIGKAQGRSGIKRIIYLVQPTTPCAYPQYTILILIHTLSRVLGIEWRQLIPLPVPLIVTVESSVPGTHPQHAIATFVEARHRRVRNLGVTTLVTQQLKAVVLSTIGI